MLAEQCAWKCVLVLVTVAVCKCLDYTSICVQEGEDVHYRAERKSELFTHRGPISLVLSWFITVWVSYRCRVVKINSTPSSSLRCLLS